MKSILVISFFLIFNSLKGQTCADTSIKTNYHANGFNLYTREKLMDSNGRNVLFGEFQDRLLNGNNIGNFLVKLNQNELINYAKKITYLTINNSEYESKIRIFKNNNYLIVPNNHNCDTCDISSFKLIFLNSSGDLIWAKKYSNQFGKINIKMINELNNGNIMLFFNIKEFENSHIDVGGLMQINSLGNILWTKYYFSDSSDISNNVETLSISDNRIYLKGGINEFFYKPYSIFTSKINALDGAIIDSKTYLDSMFGNFNSQIGNKQKNINEIITNKNEILITSSFGNNASSYNGCTSVIFDTNLIIKKAIQYKVPTNNFVENRIVASKSEEIFIYSNINPNNILTAYITKIDSNNLPKRELYFKYPENILYQIGGRKPFGLKNKNMNLINSYFQNNDLYFQLVQFPDNVPITPCYGRDTNLIQIQPYTITEVHHPFLNQAIDITDITVTDFPVTITALPLIVEKECEIISNCNLLKINPARDTICNLATEVQFSAHINGSCLKKIYWSLDTSAYSYIRAINDTTVAIKFKQNWQGKLYASINPCVDLKDSVKLYVFNTPNAVNLGKDTTLCTGSTLTLQAGIGFKDYTWQNGSSSNTLITSTSGTYSVVAHDRCGNVFKDTIVVKYYAQTIPINFGNDTTLCQNQTLILKAGKGYKNYTWQDGSVADSFKVAQAGMYFINAIDSCSNIFKDTIVINYFITRPAVKLGADIVFCPQKRYVLEAGLGYKKYTWQNGSTTNNFTATSAGLYFVNVVDSCGNESADTLQIKPAENITLKVNFANSICLYDTARIILPTIVSQYNITPTNSMELQNNVLKLFPTQNTIYDIKASTAAGCTVADTVLIKVKLCEDELYFPTAFTPNGDNVNDYFLPYSETKPISYELTIYNRYGQNIFTSKIIKIGWNGKLLSEIQNIGSFVWVCKYQFRNKLPQVKKGSFILVR